MLRIEKISPGVLDLSAVRDEVGVPVVLNGPSYRDVPDHEQDNPVLQRVRDARWVTVTPVSPLADESMPSAIDAPLPVNAPPQAPPGDNDVSGQATSGALNPDPSEPGDDGAASALNTIETRPEAAPSPVTSTTSGAPGKLDRKSRRA